MSVASKQVAPMNRAAIKPVLIWAVLGAGFIAMAIYVWGSWIMGPYFKPTLPPEPLDSTARSLAFWNEVVFCIVTLLCLWGWVVLPKIRTGRFSQMGLLLLACGSCYWMDPMSNYFSYGNGYSSYFWNMGSWAAYIPGFSYPGMERRPEAILFIGTTYLWFNAGFPALIVVFWRWLDHRFPNHRMLSVIALLLILLFIIDIVQEVLYLRMGLYTYFGGSQEWSVFGGHYYQMPIYIGVLTAFFWLGIAWVIYFRDDKGYCFVDRGVDKLGLTPGATTFVRFLALTGYANIVTLVVYFIPVQWTYMHGDAFPADTPAYLHNNLCGEKAGFPCPGKGVPIPRRDGDTTWVNIPKAVPQHY